MRCPRCEHENAPKNKVLRGVRHAPHSQSQWSASAVICRDPIYISLHPKIVDASGGMTRAVGLKNKGQKGVGE